MLALHTLPEVECVARTEASFQVILAHLDDMRGDLIRELLGDIEVVV